MITLLSARARRITIPYKDIYTSAFILGTPDGTILSRRIASSKELDRKLEEIFNENK